MAGVSAVLGVALGIGYAVAGVSAVLGGPEATVIDVPWLQATAIVVVGTLAGLAASVLPARRAARTSPMVAIAG